jgi:hypothetical protein
MSIKNYTTALILLFFISCVVALIQTNYVGSSTIYKEEWVKPRMLLHDAILNNEVPDGKTWRDLGANGTNLRVGVIYLAEFLSQSLNIHISTSYKYIDMISLVLAIMLIFKLLLRFVKIEEALIGVLFIAAILPMTYSFHYFHPWDRISLVLWLVMFISIFSNKPLLLASTMVLAILVKSDAMVIPLMYFLVHIGRDNYLRIFIISFVLTILSFGEVLILREVLMHEASRNAGQIIQNYHHLLHHNITHPAVLGLALPVILSIYAFKKSDRLIQGATLFGLILLLPHLTMVNFREIRAQMPVLVALLPGALIGLRLVINSIRLNSAKEC